MSEQPTTAAPRIGRGTAFAILAIPIGIALAAAAGFLGGIIAGFAAGLVPVIAAGLYKRGAGAPVRQGGVLPFLLISIVGIPLAIFSSFLTVTYSAFSSVGGDGGFGSPVFWTTFQRLFSGSNFEAWAFPLIAGIGFGIMGIVASLRQNPAAQNATVIDATPADPTNPAPVNPTGSAPVETPPSTPPSPGIILNGEPLDPNARS